MEKQEQGKQGKQGTGGGGDDQVPEQDLGGEAWLVELGSLEKRLNDVMDVSAKKGSIMTGVDEVFSGSEGLKEAIKRGCEVAHMAVRAADEAQMTSGHARINMVLSTLYYINHVVVATNEAQRIFAEGPRPVVAATTSGSGAKGKKANTIADQAQRAVLTAGIARFSAPDPDEANRMQQLLLYMLDTAHVRGYRRRHDMLYERRVIEDRPHIDTHAWELVCDLKTFVYDATRKEVNYDMWLNMTSVRGTVHGAVDYLANCQDVQLPDLERDRSVFSFKNGIYLAKTDTFVVYGSPEHAALPSHLVAAKFFDLEMDLANVELKGEKAMTIPTPHLQSILDFQDMSPEVSWWMYAMIGRLIYEVNELDGWQVIPFLKGAASSGKSTILTRVCQSIYERDDVGTLSNNIERKFGLSAIYDKLIFIGPEIKADIQLEQAEFQSIISGEAVQVAVKCQTARSVTWKVPGALAGNEIPKWVDNSGSINRRIVIFDFPKRVHDGDMDLGKKLENDMAAILLKANRIYLEAVRKYACKNIWKVLPNQFHLAKEEFSEATNSIVQFLRSGKLEFKKGLCMPFELFSGAYESFVNSMGVTRLKLNGDRITQPLLELGCTVVKFTTIRYPVGSKSIVTGRFIIGVDFAVDVNTAVADDIRDARIHDDPLELY